MIAMIRLDTSNRQGVIERPYSFLFNCSNESQMTDHSAIETLRENLRRVMARTGVKPTTLSMKLGHKTLVKDLLEKNGDVKLSTLIRLAGILDVDIEELIAKPRVPIVGFIGAGGQIIYEDIGETLEPDNSVLRPPGISGPLIALAVRGSSMFPTYKDGDVVFIQRVHEGVLAEYIGDDCAVRLTSGETYLKVLAHGTLPGRFTLRSSNAPDMVDVEVEWATPIVMMMPFRSRGIGQNK